MTPRSFASRLWRWLVWLVAAWIASTFLLVLLLRWIDPPASAFMLEARATALASGDRTYRQRHQWVDYAHISRNAPLAVIAAEDQRFPLHRGFDLKAIDDSIRAHRDGKRKRLRGASTITQQVAKNLFLWKGKSFVRKGLEAYFTLLLETLWPKQRIIEVYLNVAEFGRGVYGVEAASRYYFGSSARWLSAERAALLAAVLPNPRRFKVNAPSNYVLGRQSWILSQMRGLGGRSYLFAYESQ
jgi:monofunctional biosynthetic peptidoglycan transglycosylase